AARGYPVVLIRPRADGPLRIVALLGLQQGQNLFVNDAGEWAAGSYRPAYLRRHPFCMATVRHGGESSGERIICVESARIDAERGEPVADEAGQPLPWWEQTSRFISDYEADLLRTEKVCDLIDKNGILEPFSMQATSDDAEQFSVAGMLRLNEARLEGLKADTLRMLINRGIMGR